MGGTKRKQANKSAKLNPSQMKPPQGRGKRIKIYDNVRNDGTGGTAKTPNLRISPAAQLEITHLYFEGHSLCEISRRTHRARQTVTKIVRAPDIEATVMEMKGAIMGTWKEWLASLRRAVNLENDGEMAKFLFMAFGAIPAAPPKVEVTKTDSDSQQSKLDAYRMRAAMQLGLVAMERAKIFGTSLPLEREELEKLMEKS